MDGVVGVVQCQIGVDGESCSIFVAAKKRDGKTRTSDDGGGFAYTDTDTGTDTDTTS